jgi:hypothetical protein
VGGEDLLTGTVRRINRRTGVLILDTPSGLVEVVVTPAEMEDLEIGDAFVVDVADEESALTGKNRGRLP